MLGCRKFLAGSSQECHSIDNLCSQLRCHPYASYMWHAGKILTLSSENSEPDSCSDLDRGPFSSYLEGLPGCQWVEFFFQKTILNLLRHLAKDSETLDTYVICLEEEVFT